VSLLSCQHFTVPAREVLSGPASRCAAGARLRCVIAQQHDHPQDRGIRAETVVTSSVTE
jgi:hypothetical protein